MNTPVTSHKIFCIGFHKTGTTSLNRALEHLGYSVLTSFGIPYSQIRFPLEDRARELLTSHDAFEDNPWPVLFRQLDVWAPHSKFILTLRDTQSWYDSALNHFANHPTAMREWIYGHGAPKGNEEIYKQRYDRHNSDVHNYFRNRPDDLLILEFNKNFDWPDLCEFLDKPVPKIAFPHANQASRRNRRGSAVGATIKKLRSKFNLS